MGPPLYPGSSPSVIQAPVFKKEADQKILHPGAIYFAGGGTTIQQQQHHDMMHSQFHQPNVSGIIDLVESSAVETGVGGTINSSMVDEDNKLSIIPTESNDDTEAAFSEDDEETAKDIKNEELTDDDDDLPLSKVIFYCRNI